MRANISGLDHVVILVRDLDAAQVTYARLGLALTPRGFHSIGTHNHCIMFGSDYLELLAVREPHPVTQYFSQFLAVAEGAAAVALSTDDAHAAHASLRGSGVMADEPVDFSRPVDVDGTRRDARFRVVQLPVDETPGCRAFLCQHFTPELVWRSEYRQHPLGVVGIAGVSVMVDDVGGAAQAYGRVLAASPTETPTSWKLVAGDCTFSISGPSALQQRLGAARLPRRASPMLSALHLRVRDLDVAAQVLRRGGFAAEELVDGALVIGAEQAHGVALVLSEGGEGYEVT